MGRPTGQLERFLDAITVGAAQGHQRLHRALADGRTGEFVQQIRQELSGVGGAGLAYSETDVSWELPFLYAPVQRRCTFPVPHFGYGIEWVVPPATHISIEVQVAAWAISPEGWITGATMRFAVQAPLQLVGTVPYSAIAHLTFQGYASYGESDEFAE